MDELRTEVRSRGLTAAVGYNLRHWDPLRSVQRLVADGALGRVHGARAEVGQHLADWRPDTDYRTSVSARAALGGGALLELSHEVDYVTWILGEPVATSAVLSRSGRLDVDVEDTADLLIEYESGACASVHLDMLQRPAVRTARFHGDRGFIDLDLLDGRVRCSNELEPPAKQAVVSVGLRGTYLAQVRDFLDAAGSGAEPAVPLDEGILTLEVLEAARLASAEGRRVLISDVRRSERRGQVS